MRQGRALGLSMDIVAVIPSKAPVKTISVHRLLEWTTRRRQGGNPVAGISLERSFLQLSSSFPIRLYRVGGRVRRFGFLVITDDGFQGTKGDDRAVFATGHEGDGTQGHGIAPTGIAGMIGRHGKVAWAFRVLKRSSEIGKA